jgi:colanic acid/amylovoran biosynthesis protein
MKILITNIVTLNGGDFAILESMMKVMRQTYGEDTEFVVYDMHADIAAKYYPGINFRTLLFVKYNQRLSKPAAILSKFSARFSPIKRLMKAAEEYGAGKPEYANNVLTKEEKIDFDHYASADIIVSTGGTYLVENYSLSARIYDYDFTLAMKKPLVFFTQSLGPFKKEENKIDIKRVFDKASLILLRDQASYNNLKEINVDVTKARVCADVVFSDSSSAILEAAKTKTISEPIKIGISVRDWKFFKGRTAEEGLEKYYQSVAAVCEHVTLKLGGEVVFVSTCQAIVEYHVDDSRTAQNIYDLLSDAAKKKTSVNSDFHTPEDLKVIMESFDMVISTRMHSAIQALSLGIPVLPIAYEFKTKELFGKLIDKDLIIDIDTVTEEDAIKTFDRFLEYIKVSRKQMFENVNKEHLSALTPIKYLKQELSFDSKK